MPCDVDTDDVELREHDLESFFKLFDQSTISVRRARDAPRVAAGAHSKPGRNTMATAADRFNINSQLEHLQSRYVGTGHADTNRFEWAVNIHRDSYASYYGHHTMLQYFAIAENESIGRVKYNMMQVSANPRPSRPPELTLEFA
mgnify:CR=1 FL=1